MNVEQYNQEMDNEIRSRRVFTCAMLRDFDKAYNQDSASGSSWLIGKLKLGKEVLQSGGSIIVSDDKPVILASLQSFETWVHKRFPDFAKDV